MRIKVIRGGELRWMAALVLVMRSRQTGVVTFLSCGSPNVLEGRFKGGQFGEQE